MREMLPFKRGQTLNGGGGTAAQRLLNGLEWEGMIFPFPDLSQSGIAPETLRSNRQVICMVVRNVSGATLYGKQLATLAVDGLNGLARITGHTTTPGARGVPIDDRLGSAGVLNNDLCYVVLKGPCEILVGEAGDDWNGDIADGAPLWAATGTNSTGGTTAGGRVANLTAAGQTGATGAISAALNYIGRALSAKTTQQTTQAQSVLVDCNIVL